jgi:hypothetical protein
VSNSLSIGLISILSRTGHKGGINSAFSRFWSGAIVGVDPDQARVGDIAVEVVHSGFYTRAEVWVKVIDGTRGWASTSHLQTQFFFTSYLA